jgi:hypothetical protein
MSNKLLREAKRRAVREVEDRLGPVLAEFGLLLLNNSKRKQLFRFFFDEGQLDLDGEILSIPIVVEMNGEAAEQLGPEDLLELGKRVSQLPFTLVVDGVVRQGDIIYLASELKKSESAGGGSNATQQRIMEGIAGLYSYRGRKAPSAWRPFSIYLNVLIYKHKQKYAKVRKQKFCSPSCPLALFSA